MWKLAPLLFWVLFFSFSLKLTFNLMGGVSRSFSAASPCLFCLVLLSRGVLGALHPSVWESQTGEFMRWASLVARQQRVHLRCRRHRFNPWVRKIPWRRRWQPPAVNLPGKSHGQRSLVAYSPRGCKRVRHDLVAQQKQVNEIVETKSLRELSIAVPVEDQWWTAWRDCG